tara:strand:- start:179 stop:823 length:645 start_codon:yes stop_codon:yes gene_type:complete
VSKDLYSTFKAAGSTAGKYQGSWYKQEGIRGEMTAESMLSEERVQGIQDTTSAITEAIGLARSYRDEKRAEKEHKELMGTLGFGSTKGSESLMPDTTVASAGEDIAGDLDVSDTSGFDVFEDPTTGTTGTSPLSNEAYKAVSGTTDTKPNLYEEWQTATGGLTKSANLKLYEADPSMKGKSKEIRASKYKELFGDSDELTIESLMPNTLGILNQ